MLFDISELDSQGVWLDHTVELPPFSWEGGVDVSCDPVLLTGQLRPSSRGVEFDGRFEAHARLCCTRCLAPLERDLAARFRLCFVPGLVDDDVAEEREVEEDEIDLFPLEASVIDFAAVLSEQIDLALPFRVLCQENCRGLCPSCGVNLNDASCGCEPPKEEKATGGLADLRQLLNERTGDEPSGRK